MPTYSRLSARVGNPVKLEVQFKRGGVAADPYAIRRVDIYRGEVLPHLLVAQALLDSPAEATYPSPLTQPAVTDQTGLYELVWDVPTDLVAPDVYLDVWRFLPDNPCSLDSFAGSTSCVPGTDGISHYANLDDSEVAALLNSVCHRFWVYPDGWEVDDKLLSLRFAFEPLDQRYTQPEVRPLEIGLMPLPLYEFDYNYVMPKIPYLTAAITIETLHGELLVENAAMEIGLRQGYYRSNPFVLRYMLNTANFLKGTYRYRVLMSLPDGSSRSSGNFFLTIA